MTKVIDNFLPMEDFIVLKHIIMGHNFPFYINSVVSHSDEKDEAWRWYATHLLYEYDFVCSDHFQTVYNLFIDKFRNEVGYKSLIRIKVNLYPHTETLKENNPHVDYPYEHHAALFSLNTCDGFTRLKDGTKIDSVENRIVFFNGGDIHNSTTTTEKFRYNINFNWL
jgi:hypothetical protein